MAVDSVSVNNQFAFDTPIDAVNFNSDKDLYISDSSGYILAEFGDGDIKTKKFDSSKIPTISDYGSNADLNISDEEGYVIAQFKDGHFKTKNFDSRNSGSGSEENEYATVFTEQEDALYNKVKSQINGNTLVFSLVTDTHIGADGRTLQYAKIARKIGERLGVDFHCHLGDMIDEASPYLTQNRHRIDLYMKEARKSYIPFLYTIGHHEQYGPYPNLTYLPIDIMGQTLRYNRYLKATYDINNKFNYFVDFDIQKIRCIFLDSIYQKWGFSTDTINWVRDIALVNLSNGYKVLFFSHVPCLTAASFMPNDAGHIVINDSALRDVLNSFVNNGGKIIAYIYGHIHGDNIVPINMSVNNFPFISTACMRNFSNGGISPSQYPIVGDPIYYPDRTEETINEYCLDVYCVHSDTENIDIFRFGVGSDRTFTKI